MKRLLILMLVLAALPAYAQRHIRLGDDDVLLFGDGSDWQQVFDGSKLVLKDADDNEMARWEDIGATGVLTLSGRFLPRQVDDAGMDGTAGTEGEIAYNLDDDKLYTCTVTGNPATWIAAVGGGGSMDDFTLAGDTGTPQTIADGNTLTIAGGAGIDTVAAATDKVTVAVDATVANVDKAENISGTWEFQDSVSLRFGNDADFSLQFSAPHLTLKDTQENVMAYWVDAGTTGDFVSSGDIAVNGGDLTSSAATFNLLNATPTTINFGGVADINIGGTVHCYEALKLYDDVPAYFGDDDDASIVYNSAVGVLGLDADYFAVNCTTAVIRADAESTPIWSASPSDGEVILGSSNMDVLTCLGRLIPRDVDDPDMDATAGTEGEVLRNLDDLTLYLCTVTGAPATWTAIGAGGGGSFEDFVLAGDIGTPQTISDGNTLSILGGTGIATTAANTDTLTVSLSHLGLENLSDPGEVDRVYFWDDNAGASAWLMPNQLIAISGTNLDVDNDLHKYSWANVVDADLTDAITVGASGSVNDAAIPAGVTRDAEWDTEAEINTVLGTTMWTAASDGTGSGLDADKLDGQEASAFMEGFTAAGGAGDDQTISDGDTLTLAGGTGITTTGSATDTITIAADYEATLAAIAGLAPVANEMIYFTDADVAARLTLSAAGRAILDDADAAAQRATLDLEPGVDVQAWSARLDELAINTLTGGLMLTGAFTSTSTIAAYSTITAVNYIRALPPNNTQGGTCQLPNANNYDDNVDIWLMRAGHNSVDGDFVIAADSADVITIDEITFLVSIINDLAILGGDATIGVDGTTRGVLYTTDGGADAPGVWKTDSCNGTSHHGFVSDNGRQLRLSDALPTDDRDGIPIGLVLSPGGAFAADDTTPSVLGGEAWEVPDTWTAGHDITMFDDGVERQEIMILGHDADCTVIDGGNLKLNGNWVADPDDTLTLVFTGTDWVERCRSPN